MRRIDEKQSRNYAGHDADSSLHGAKTPANYSEAAMLSVFGAKAPEDEMEHAGCSVSEALTS